LQLAPAVGRNERRKRIPGKRLKAG
jgi:hypothetical protein